MPRKRGSRVYWRSGRAYGDFRSHAEVGGGREALVPPGENLATRDRDIAEKLAADRLRELEQRRRNKHLLGIEETATLAEYGAYHLEKKAESGKFTFQWLETSELHLRAAVDFFGAGRDVGSISVRDVQRFSGWLASRDNGRGSKLSPASQRKYLNSLSNLYRRAAGEGYVPPGYNPVAAMMEKPSAATPREADWLEVPDAALFLEACRHYRPDRSDGIPPRMLHAIVAVFLLSGGRESEVMGLELDDVSLDRRRIAFRPNTWRRLKTKTSHRTVPIWPQLEGILREYIYGGEAPPRELLFPSPRANGDAMISDLRKALDAAAGLIDWPKGQVRTKLFRHTYCAARLQTLDNGAPVSTFTVSRELGHGGTSLVKRVYGHLGDVRHRSEVVEYRTEQHGGKLSVALSELRVRAPASG